MKSALVPLGVPLSNSTSLTVTVRALARAVSVGQAVSRLLRPGFLPDVWRHRQGCSSSQGAGVEVPRRCRAGAACAGPPGLQEVYCVDAQSLVEVLVTPTRKRSSAAVSLQNLARACQPMNAPALNPRPSGNGLVPRQGQADPRSASCSITASRSLSRSKPPRDWRMRGFVARRSRLR